MLIYDCSVSKITLGWLVAPWINMAREFATHEAIAKINKFVNVFLCHVILQ